MTKPPYRFRSTKSPDRGCACRLIGAFEVVGDVTFAASLLLHRSPRQIEPQPAAGSVGLPIRDPRGRNVLYTTAAGLEDYELFLAHASRLSAGCELGKVGMDLVFSPWLPRGARD